MQFTKFFFTLVPVQEIGSGLGLEFILGLRFELGLQLVLGLGSSWTGTSMDEYLGPVQARKKIVACELLCTLIECGRFSMDATLWRRPVISTCKEFTPGTKGDVNVAYSTISTLVFFETFFR